MRVRAAKGRMVEEAFPATPTSRGNNDDMTKLPLFTIELAVSGAIIFVVAGGRVCVNRGLTVSITARGALYYC